MGEKGDVRAGDAIGIRDRPHKSGARVGFAVDGSASNDSSNLLKEMQTALLVHRVGTGVDKMPARDVLRIAPRAEYTVVAGEVLVEKGRLVRIDEEALFHRAPRQRRRGGSAAQGGAVEPAIPAKPEEGVLPPGPTSVAPRRGMG